MSLVGRIKGIAGKNEEKEQEEAKENALKISINQITQYDLPKQIITFANLSKQAYENGDTEKAEAYEGAMVTSIKRFNKFAKKLPSSSTTYTFSDEGSGREGEDDVLTEIKCIAQDIGSLHGKGSKKVKLEYLDEVLQFKKEIYDIDKKAKAYEEKH